jgi:endonuclease/exonuclease/phosphatase family metal-dependent hydrolase
MALKQVKVMLVSDAILNARNALFTKSFDAEFMLRIASVHLSCFENNFSEIDF